MKPEVWEAIQRLRRFEAGEELHRIHVSPPGAWMLNSEEWYDLCLTADRQVAADYLLSIAPDAPKPEPIDPKGSSGFAVWGNNIREASWDADFDGGSLMVHVGTSRYGTSTTPLYRTESDARLALQWQRFEELETSGNR